MNTRLLALMVYNRTRDTRRMFAALKLHNEREWVENNIDICLDNMIPMPGDYDYLGRPLEDQIKLRLDWETE